MKPQALHCDIFCRVIDNFGDAGVCWRLARQLVAEHGWRVRLWIDDPATLAKLAPDPTADGVEVHHWRAEWADTAPAEVVIEAFACDLPEPYVARMAACATAPVWLNLEYLSAEDWVAGCHGMVSPHPRLPLTKHFFFPGFTAQTGGLLREHDYDARRAAFDDAAWRREFGLPPRRAEELTISLFSYANPALPALLAAWAASPTPITLLRPGSTEAAWTNGNLSVHPLPFVPQPRYDELLWACNLNFVRGEDSFVRAQWAAKPFVWHIYPQDDAAHRVKLDAFLARHPSGTALAAFWHAWNGAGTPDWPAFAAQLPQLAAEAQKWAIDLHQLTDLAGKLVEFSTKRVK